MSELKNYQRDIDADHEVKRSFVDAGNETDEESDGEDEYGNLPIQIVSQQPKKKAHIDVMLMAQLTAQQKETFRAQKIIGKLRAQIESDEIRTRYLKLDLNNAQVKAEEETVKTKDLSTKLIKAQLEIWIVRMLFTLYIFWYITRLF